MRISDWSSDVCSSDLDCIGLDGVSKNTAVVGTESASSHCALSSPSTKTTSTPQRGRISLHTTKQDPNRLRAATNRSPLPNSAPNENGRAQCREQVGKYV